MFIKGKYNIIQLFVVLTWFLFLSQKAFAVQPGSYDHENEKAYIITYDSGTLKVDFSKDKIILGVDFKNKLTRQLAKHKYIANLTVNHDRTLLSYTDFDYIYIIRIADGERIAKLSRRGEALTWAKDRNMLAFFDTNKGQLGYYNIEDEVIVEAPYEGNELFGMLWDLDCKCFYFEVAKNYHSPRKIYQIKNGELHEVKLIKTTSFSPGKRFYLKFLPSETSSSFALIDYEKDSIVFNSPVVGAIKNYELLWGENTIRILGKLILVDYETKTLLYPSYMAAEGLHLKKMPNIVIKSDMAADYNNHILLWNGSVFEVEDINTGKIIKTYEKYW